MSERVTLRSKLAGPLAAGNWLQSIEISEQKNALSLFSNLYTCNIDSLDTAFYAEFDSTGPGAHLHERDSHAHMLTSEQAKQYEPREFLRGSDNWNPLEPPMTAAQ